MGFSRLFLASTALLLLSINAARADSTYLLQLGSYGSQAEANQGWADVKSKNADVVGGLNLHVAEVALPPDDKISYRTQAGPVGTREQASALCDTLQSRQVPCYVVETALFTADAGQAAVSQPPAGIPADVAPAAGLVATSGPTAEMAAAPAAPTADAAPAFVNAAAAPQPAALPAPQPAPAALPPAVEMPAPMQAASVPPAPAPIPSVATHAMAAPAPAALPSAPPAAPMVDTATATPPAPVEKPGFFRSLFGESTPAPTASPAPAPTAAPVANVDVAEAIRVPLGSGHAQASPHALAGLPAVHGLGGTPSQSTHNTYWAQISYFTNEMAARAFYDQFRSDYPQFADGVRVRITRPYLQSAGHVSLRVGPFAEPQDAGVICRAAYHAGAGCSLVRDIGASSSANALRARMSYHTGFERNARGSEFAANMQASNYWVQLGSFRSPGDAWDHWKDLGEEHAHLLQRVHAHVTTPAGASSSLPVFRLRAGPFTSQASAASLCGRLKSAGTNCLVLADR